MCDKNTFLPNGKKCAVMLSVNLDAEFFGKIYYPDANVDEGDILRLGVTGMQWGLEHILDTLESFKVKATFFIPGEVARRYPKQVKLIAAKGHEIGCHGLYHEIFAHMTAEEQKAALQKAKAILEEISGRRVTGFRMPEGEITEETLCIVKELGFEYSSSLSDNDIPYIRYPAQLLELPIRWELFDLPYFVFAFDPPIPPGQSRSAFMDDVLQNWLLELEGAYKWGTLLNLQLEPQATGEQGRIFMLEKFLTEVKKHPDIWITTGSELTAYCSSKK